MDFRANAGWTGHLASSVNLACQVWLKFVTNVYFLYVGIAGRRGEPGKFNFSYSILKIIAIGRDGVDGPPGPVFVSFITSKDYNFQPGEPGKNGPDGLYCECPPRESRPNALPAASNYGEQVNIDVKIYQTFIVR
jgi:hypothetical protein